MKSEDYLKKAYRSIYENDFEQAIQWFEEALALAPDNADIHYRCSITCARSNRLEKAMAHARLASAIAPQQEEYKLHFDRMQSKELTMMAKRLLEGEGRDNESIPPRSASAAASAVNLLERAVRLDPLSVDAQAWLAIAYTEQGKYESAFQALTEAAALPQDESTAKQLRELTQRIKKYMN